MREALARRAGPTFRLPIRETSTERSQGKSNSNLTATWEQSLHWLGTKPSALARLRRAACRTYSNSSFCFHFRRKIYSSFFMRNKRAPSLAKLQCERRTAAANVTSRSHAIKTNTKTNLGERKQAHKPKVLRLFAVASLALALPPSFLFFRYFFYYFFSPASF